MHDHHHSFDDHRALSRAMGRVLAWVWWGTAATSLLGLAGTAPVSLQLLAEGGITDPALATALVLAGAGLDAVIGCALWWWPGRFSAALALGGMALMTLVATALLPRLWLDPLGPLLKNLPIAALLRHGWLRRPAASPDQIPEPHTPRWTSTSP